MNVSEKVKGYLDLSEKMLEESSPKVGVGLAILAQATMDFYLNKNKLDLIEVEE